MKLDFVQVMVYVVDLERAKEFYVDKLGFRLVDEHPGFYARIKSPASDTTIALHKKAEGDPPFRLYFEAEKLDEAYEQLRKRGVRFDRAPADMPWGWRQTFLHDPENHEISIFYAGAKRLRPTPSKAMKPGASKSGNRRTRTKAARAR